MKRGRKPRMDRDTLVRMLTQMRSDGITCKAIATELGYTASHIENLCIRFGIVKTFKYKRVVDETALHALQNTGGARPEET